MVSIFCCAFIVMPTVSSAYWLLTVIAGQLYLTMYLLMFAAAIKLRAKKADCYAYKIRGVKTTRCISVLGSLGCFGFILIGIFAAAFFRAFELLALLSYSNTFPFHYDRPSAHHLFLNADESL